MGRQGLLKVYGTESRAHKQQQSERQDKSWIMAGSSSQLRLRNWGCDSLLPTSQPCPPPTHPVKISPAVLPPAKRARTL
jgi:hypothetical protein